MDAKMNAKSALSEKPLEQPILELGGSEWTSVRVHFLIAGINPILDTNYEFMQYNMLLK